MDLATAIPLGAAHALTKAAIAKRLGWTTREFEEAVEQARKSGGLAVCSGSAGYWQPETVEEYATNVRNRRRRALNQLVTNRGERRLLARWRASEAVQGVLWAA